MKSTIFLNLLFIIALSFSLIGQEIPKSFKNPILPGFSPDPSICRVGDDYYLVNSSFIWFPGIPVYHSKDLVNWELISHAITNPEPFNFDGVKDRDGIWAVTIRHHDGLFYLTTTAYKCGGNFYMTATNPSGPWSGPFWLKDAPGIDPSLMWDDDNKCYYVGNVWDPTKKQIAIWAQEIDLQNQKLVGERKTLTWGHANNAEFAEGPHIYKQGNSYMLMLAEGGTDMYHAISVHHSSSILGDYKADKINPVLTHRHLGEDYPLQAIGHGDFVQTQKGDWWAVVLGKRLLNGEVPLSRETFLCKVNFENGSPIFNPGFGKVLLEQERPDLPWTLVKPQQERDEFEGNNLSPIWHTIRIPKEEFYNQNEGELSLNLRPQIADSLVNSSILIQRTRDYRFSATTKLRFETSRENEQAGMIFYRTTETYYSVLKEKSSIVLIRKSPGKKEIVAELPYKDREVIISAIVEDLGLQFRVGKSPDAMMNIGTEQSIALISENAVNRFNGAGIGMYATSNGENSKNMAVFEWFEYKKGATPINKILKVE